MNKSPKGLLTWFTIAFFVIWATLIGIEYGNKHPGYYFAFTYFRYIGLYLLVALFIGLSYFTFFKLKKKSSNILIRGYHILLTFLLYFGLIIFSNRNYGQTPSSASDLFSFFGSSVFNMMLLILFFLIMRSLGQLLRVRALNNTLNNSFTVDTSMGLMVFVSVMFVVGALNLLSVTTVMLLIFISVIVNVTYFVQNIKTLLIEPISTKGISLIGWSSVLFLMFFLCVNFLSIDIPYPSGFDSRNVYVNISKLIAGSGGLVEGYQPYNWSLLMSIGFIMFDYAELALGLSFSAIVLSLIGAKEIMRRILKLDLNQTFFVLLLFAVTPSLVNQMFTEIKGDFGMLLIQIASILVFFQWYTKVKSDNTSTQYKLIILLGLLCGFGMGIKLINMFLVFIMLSLIWWENENIYGLASILLISVSVLIFAGIDELSGLQVYHKSIGTTVIVSVIVGLSLLIYSFIKQRQKTIRKLMYSSCFGVALLFMFSPWIVKNFSESDSLSMKTLILGNAPGPGVGNFQLIRRNYEKSKKK
jgi:hypothetical protein